MKRTIQKGEGVSDRAMRYRAQKAGVRPVDPKQCGFCGSKRNVIPHHVNGDERETVPDNLMWACKSCNSVVHHVMRSARIGRLTNQRNPRGLPARLKAYDAAIKVMRGVWPGNVADAVATIRATPASVRSEYTSRSWGARRQIYGPSGRQTEIPF